MTGSLRCRRVGFMSSVQNSLFYNSDMFNLYLIFSTYILSLTSVSEAYLFSSLGQY
jgi:hypothetical protein